MRTKKIARHGIDCDAFHLARKRAGLTVDKAAFMLDVTPRTIRNWENETSQIPYAAFRLMRLYSGHSLMHADWEGWSIYRGELVSPTGRGFAPYQLNYLGNYLWMAKQWLKDRKTLKTLKPSIPEPTVRDEASDATASSGARLHQIKIGANLTVAGLHQKTLSSVKFGKYSEFRTIGDAANDVIASEVL